MNSLHPVVDQSPISCRQVANRSPICRRINAKRLPKVRQWVDNWLETSRQLRLYSDPFPYIYKLLYIWKSLIKQYRFKSKWSSVILREMIYKKHTVLIYRHIYNEIPWQMFMFKMMVNIEVQFVCVCVCVCVRVRRFLVWDKTFTVRNLFESPVAQW